MNRMLYPGIIYLVKRGKIAALTPHGLPDASIAAFDEWKPVKLRSIDIFLLSTWVWCALSSSGLAIGSSMTSSKTQLEQ